MKGEGSVVELAPLRAYLDGVTDIRGMLIPILQETQRIYGYVPETAAALIAERLGIYPSHVFGVLTFYAQFHLTPRGKHTIRACAGTACHVRGGDRVINRLEKVLGVGHGGTTADGAFSFEKVACLGACGLAPVVMVDDDAHGAVDPSKAEKIVRDLRRAMNPAPAPAEAPKGAKAGADASAKASADRSAAKPVPEPAAKAAGDGPARESASVPPEGGPAAEGPDTPSGPEKA